MTKPDVTVIIPFRNQSDLLEQACRSLREQSQSRWHALLINDGSTLQAVRVAELLCQNDPRFKLLHVANSKHFPGPWLARNVGLHVATSPLVAFLDADDLWHPL